MTVWYTADLHFGHKNILKYEAEARPFSTLEEMREVLIRNWNDRVAHDDMVWILGDAAMGKRDESLQAFKRMMGYKILICGNHDHPWIGNPRREKHDWESIYLEAGGFDEIHLGGPLWSEVGDQLVMLSHFPHAGDHTEEDRYSEYRPPDNGEWLLHGHVHSAYKFGERTINVGVDVNDLAPVSEDQIAQWIEERS